jgi:hypothetical protein
MRRRIHGCHMGEEEDTCMPYEEEDRCMPYEEEDTCMPHEEIHACARNGSASSRPASRDP